MCRKHQEWLGIFLLKLSDSVARMWWAGLRCLQLQHSSIIESRVTNERRSSSLFIHHCLPLHPSFPLHFHSSLFLSHCLTCGSMWLGKKRTCQCYQHATDDSFEGDRDFQLVTPVANYPRSSLGGPLLATLQKQTAKLWATILCFWNQRLYFDT